MYKIDTFEDLIFLIENTELEQQQIESLVQKTLNVLIINEWGKEFNKTELIKRLKDFWNKWGNKPLVDRPFLLTDSLGNY